MGMADKTGKTKCTGKTEVWSRTVGFYRPTSDWNRGMLAQYRDRVAYSMDKATDELFNEVKDDDQ